MIQPIERVATELERFHFDMVHNNHYTHERVPFLLKEAADVIRVQDDIITALRKSKGGEHRIHAKVPLAYSKIVARRIGSHYNTENYECWDVAKELCKDKKPWEAVLFFNVFKYIWRYPKKNGVEDLVKATNYLEKLINELSVEETN